MDGQGKTLLFQVITNLGRDDFYADGIGVAHDKDLPSPYQFQWRTIEGKLARRGGPGAQWWIDCNLVQVAYQCYLAKLIVEGDTPEMRL